VRLHALKNYVDMARTVEDVPAMRATFNIVPCLAAQLDRLAHGGPLDTFAELARRPVETWSQAERAFAVDQFFSVHRETMLLPHRRFAELEALKRSREEASQGAQFTDQELRDLCVCFELAWCGRALREHPVVRALLAKERGYSHADSLRLAEVTDAFVAGTWAHYQRLASSRQVELTASPMYHPIVPLLIDTAAARVADPSSPLPARPFRHPEDATAQIVAGRDTHTRFFGAPPKGMWPPEGSLSPAAVRLYAEAGVSWLVSDEMLLAKSLGPAAPPDAALRPWRFGGCHLFFRHHELSDRIGFVYSSWNIADAVADFTERLRALLRKTQLEHPIVVIALDGENAWEHYRHGGYAFLDALYAALVSDPLLEPVTFSEWLEVHGEHAGTLPHLASGSWIAANFRTWAGETSKDKAWSLLADARAALSRAAERAGHPTLPPEWLDLAMRAEASDWFWWMGEGHSSHHDAEFDALFRVLLQKMHRLAGEEPPSSLKLPIAPRVAQAPSVAPTRLLSPWVTGSVDSYFEWLGAGQVDASQGAIQRGSSTLKRLYFGYDHENLYVRVDLDGPASEALRANTALEVQLTSPAELVLTVRRGTRGDVEVSGGPPGAARAAVGAVVEVAIRLEAAGVVGAERAPIELAVVLVGELGPLDRLPLEGPVRFSVSPTELGMRSWYV
jgi:alpha-amylase/alpha-mannosidase (GH57 family)